MADYTVGIKTSEGMEYEISKDACKELSCDTFQEAVRQAKRYFKDIGIEGISVQYVETSDGERMNNEELKILDDSIDREYCLRILYDIGYGRDCSTEEAYDIIKPICDSFFENPEYANAPMSLYEAVVQYVNSPSFDNSEEKETSDHSSAEYAKFESFVSLYNKMDEQGIEFTIDDKCFDKTEIEDIELDEP